jgi:hypothetical protein
MALPRLNDVPYYELIIPSNKQKVKFRPFLVKEQKVLLIAYESRDIKQILNSVMDCISFCVEGVDISELPSFDIDYIFTQIRTKSAGENTEVGIKCTNCEKTNNININLEEISIEVPERDMSIKLNDIYTLNMKYPNYKEMIGDNVLLNDKRSGPDQMIATLRQCMHSIQTEEENIILKNETIEEIDEFINSLNEEQYIMIAKFIENLPQLRYEKDYECKHCEKKNTLTIEGLQDFFT